MNTKIGFELHNEFSMFNGSLRVHIMDSTIPDKTIRISHVMKDDDLRQLYNKLKEKYGEVN